MSKTMKAIVLALVLCVLFALGATAMAAGIPTTHVCDWDADSVTVTTVQEGDCDTIGIYKLTCNGVWLNGDKIVICEKFAYRGYYGHETVEKILPANCAYGYRLGDYCVLCNEFVAHTGA